MWPQFYTRARGVIFVVDAADKSRIACAKDELHTLVEHSEFRNRSWALLIYVNKTDIDSDERMTTKQVTTILGLSKLSQNYKKMDIHAQACSGVTGAGIEDGLRWLCRHVSTASR